MKKNFVLDTNVLLDNPHSFLRFAENNVVIPITVLEELDKFKRDLTTVGRNARAVARLLDRYRAAGDLSKGVPMENGGTLRVMTNLGHEPPMPFPTLGKTADSLIIATALKLKKLEELPVVFVTRDINLRLRADAIGLDAANYTEEEVVPADEMYSGRAAFEVSREEYENFLTVGAIAGEKFELLANQCATLTVTDEPELVTDARYHLESKQLRAISRKCENVWGIQPRNEEQAFALDMLLDDEVELVTLSGKAGTGKTLLVIAAGMSKVVDEKAYIKLVVARPIMPMGKELGFLPGAVGDKMRPWMQPVFDNLELIMNAREKGQAQEKPTQHRSRKGRNKGKKTATENIRNLADTGVLEVEPLTYIRGRSLPKQFLVIDEAQNLTNHEVKTIITRASEGTKVVLTGDPDQIDNPFLDAATNGLSTVVERFKGEELAGHITLVKGERSPLSELASNIL